MCVISTPQTRHDFSVASMWAVNTPQNKL